MRGRVWDKPSDAGGAAAGFSNVAEGGDRGKALLGFAVVANTTGSGSSGGSGVGSDAAGTIFGFGDRGMEEDTEDAEIEEEFGEI